jgi:hypothetical protein
MFTAVGKCGFKCSKTWGGLVDFGPILGKSLINIKQSVKTLAQL